MKTPSQIGRPGRVVRARDRFAENQKIRDSARYCGISFLFQVWIDKCSLPQYSALRKQQYPNFEKQGRDIFEATKQGSNGRHSKVKEQKKLLEIQAKRQQLGPSPTSGRIEWNITKCETLDTKAWGRGLAGHSPTPIRRNTYEQTATHSSSPLKLLAWQCTIEYRQFSRGSKRGHQMNDVLFQIYRFPSRRRTSAAPERAINQATHCSSGRGWRNEEKGWRKIVAFRKCKRQDYKMN